MELRKNDKVSINPNIVLREEYDNWAILFDPDSKTALGINPIGVFIWKLMADEYTIGDILHKLEERCENIPDGSFNHLSDFIEDLHKKGLIKRPADQK
jgi:SynChlorMet cassette protein ScmD